jgi:hypothetical protein
VSIPHCTYISNIVYHAVDRHLGICLLGGNGEYQARHCSQNNGVAAGVKGGRGCQIGPGTNGQGPSGPHWQPWAAIDGCW